MHGKPKGRFYFGTSCPDISRLKTVPGILYLLFSSPGQSWAWVTVSSELSPTGCNSHPPPFRPSSYTFLESLWTPNRTFGAVATANDSIRANWPGVEESCFQEVTSLWRQREVHTHREVSLWNLKGTLGGYVEVELCSKSAAFKHLHCTTSHHVFPLQNFRFFLLVKWLRTCFRWALY